MLRAISLLLTAAILPQPAAAVCILEPLQVQLEASDTVFIATLTGSKISDPPIALENGKDYRIDFSYKISERIKGDSASVRSIYTVNLYRDSHADVSWDFAEETRLVPGDNVLIVAKGEGDVQVGFCTASRPWNIDSTELEAFRLKQL